MRSASRKSKSLVYGNLSENPSYPCWTRRIIWLHRANFRRSKSSDGPNCITLCSRYTCGSSIGGGPSAQSDCRSSYRNQSRDSYHFYPSRASRYAGNVRRSLCQYRSLKNRSRAWKSPFAHTYRNRISSRNRVANRRSVDGFAYLCGCATRRTAQGATS